MKKHVTKILRQIASEKGTDSAQVKHLYKKLKKSWKDNITHPKNKNHGNE